MDPLLPVRRRGAPLLAALHALGGAVRALAILAGLDRRQRRGPDRHAAGRVRLCRDARRVAGRPRRAVRVLGAGRPPLARAVSGRVAAHPHGADLHRLRRRSRGRRGAAPPRPPRRARRGHRLPRPQPAVPRRPPRAAQARDRADRRTGGTRPRVAHGYLDGHQGHEVRGCVVRVSCQRPLRDRHRERLECARPRRCHPPLRGRVEAVAPGRDLRGVLGAAGAGLGRLRLHGHQSASVRGGADQDRPAPGRGSLRRDPRARDALLPAARRLFEPDRGAGAHPRSARDRGHGRARVGGPRSRAAATRTAPSPPMSSRWSTSWPAGACVAAVAAAASWRTLNAASDAYAGLRIRAPRLAYRAAMRHAPWAAHAMLRGRDAMRRRAGG